MHVMKVPMKIKFMLNLKGKYYYVAKVWIIWLVAERSEYNSTDRIRSEIGRERCRLLVI